MLLCKRVVLGCSLFACWLPITLQAQTPDQADIYERLRRLEERQMKFEKLLEEKDARIRELEAELARDHKDETAQSLEPTTAQPAQSEAVESKAVDSARVEPDEPKSDKSEGDIATAPDEDNTSPFGTYTPGKGFTVARTDMGELTLSLTTYVRYLNQKGLDNTYIDHFGNVQNTDIRNDFQVNKVFLYTKGWFLDPKFRYFLYVWSTNTALGSTSNNLVAGNIRYKFSDAFTLGGGVLGLPATRSMTGQFPYWHRVDNRLIADEFMRGSFTQGLWADGRIAEGLHYNMSIGNNLSNFGVSASKLDDDINTFSGALVWMPTTGEFGPRAAIGDYEYHQNVATLFGLHGTFSTEDKQSQPDQDAPENTQIRLSDGTTIFTPDALAPGTTVNKVDYRMFALNGGLKYRGFALEGEVYYRLLDNFKANGHIPFNNLTDKGFQLNTSMMLMPKTLQLYANGSKIFGEYGDPWDAGIGFNWWPFRQRGVRFNSELIYLRESPVGYASLPYTIGANGLVFVGNLEVAF